MSEIEAGNGEAIQDLFKDASSTSPETVNNTANANGSATLSKASSTSTIQATTSDKPTTPKNNTPRKTRGPTKAQQIAALYSNPLPLKTFPLPTIIPHNPLSVLQFLYTWVSQVIYPPTSHPTTYTGVFSPSLRAVHVTSPESIRALWQEGFYGKGSLSRSELSWLDREKRRIGEGASKTSEEVTRQRRAERQQVKWERARVQQEAIEAKRQEEELAAKNEYIEKEVLDENVDAVVGHTRPLINGGELGAPTGPMQILSMPNSIADIKINGDVEPGTSTSAPPDASAPSPSEIEVSALPTTSSVSGTIPSEFPPKNVRFSAAVDNKTISAESLLSTTTPSNLVITTSKETEEIPLVIKDKEHLQLTTEEAFFLHYGLGVLDIYNSDARTKIATRDLFNQFRQASYFPVQSGDESECGEQMARPDDNFMINYVVYHHFRSLGWVVRGGVKFGVDYLLYNRGPVFSHAEFAVMILPSYSDEYWKSKERSEDYPQGRKEYTEERLRKRGKWSWLHAVNRVNAQVKKTLVLVYVDVPAPLAADEEAGWQIDKVLARYKVREIVLRRWVSNRSRD